MFAFVGLKKTKVWGRIVLLLLLCVAIHPLSVYPHAKEDEDPWSGAEKLDNDESYDLVRSNDEEDFEEEDGGEDLLEDATTGVESETSDVCVPYRGRCQKIKGALPCCKSDPPLKCAVPKDNIKKHCI